MPKFVFALVALSLTAGSALAQPATPPQKPTPSPALPAPKSLQCQYAGKAYTEGAMICVTKDRGAQCVLKTVEIKGYAPEVRLQWEVININDEAQRIIRDLCTNAGASPP
jgi:hypothetical protein